MKSAILLTWIGTGMLLLAQQTPQGFGDLFTKAPPDVDAALRARVSAFFQLHKEKKYRKADDLVHEDAKEIYFASDKHEMRDFKLISVSFEENFTRARAVVDMDTDLNMPGYGKTPVHRPVPTFWKLDKGEWWWYIPEEYLKAKECPFGKCAPGPEGDSARVTVGAQSALSNFQAAFKNLQDSVKVEKTSVELPSHEAADAEITVTNNFEGPVHLSISAPDIPGMAIYFQKTMIEVGESTKLRFVSRPISKGYKQPFQAVMTVEEVGKRTTIQVNFLQPPNNEPKPGSYVDPRTGKVTEPPKQ